MKAAIGLGNPGPSYARTRHNVGWFVLDSLIPLDRWVRGDGPFLFAGYPAVGSECVLVKPLTFMNLSGEAAVAVCRQFTVGPADLLVLLDDVNLPTGDLRLRRSGSAGGHNGMASIGEALQTQDVPRLRIGIGRPSEPGGLVDYVLSPFSEEEEPVVRQAVIEAGGIVRAFCSGGFEGAAELYSRWKAGSRSEPVAGWEKTDKQSAGMNEEASGDPAKTE
ncbi:MAG TPA: aminoacyl-tRNA hydrolase [Candidatus Latescibacteria bacterium]|nr:aminoacyl-tRNA hydrolase [Candidatus Latescibacterota bacterium]